jgi:hypothetical protein
MLFGIFTIGVQTYRDLMQPARRCDPFLPLARGGEIGRPIVVVSAWLPLAAGDTTMADLERVLQQLHDSEINAGIQTFYDAGIRVWIGDESNGSCFGCSC